MKCHFKCNNSYPTELEDMLESLEFLILDFLQEPFEIFLREELFCFMKKFEISKCILQRYDLFARFLFQLQQP